MVDEACRRFEFAHEEDPQKAYAYSKAEYYRGSGCPAHA